MKEDQKMKISLFEFQKQISDLAELDPAFKKSAMIILNGGSYEEALASSFTPEEVEEIINTNCGELTSEGIKEALEDEETRSKAEFLLKKVNEEFLETK